MRQLAVYTSKIYLRNCYKDTWPKILLEPFLGGGSYQKTTTTSGLLNYGPCTPQTTVYPPLKGERKFNMY